MSAYEEYECGCVSKSAPNGRDLPGYCGKHGDNRRMIHRSGKRGAAASISAFDRRLDEHKGDPCPPK